MIPFRQTVSAVIASLFVSAAPAPGFELPVPRNLPPAHSLFILDASVPAPVERPQNSGGNTAAPAAASPAPAAKTPGASLSGASLSGAAEKLPRPGPKPLSGKASAVLKDALDALRVDDYAEVARVRRRLSDPLDQKIITWLLARSGSKTVPAGDIVSAIRAWPAWPAAYDLRVKLERALERDNHSSAEVYRILSEFPPVSEPGQVLLAEAMMKSGRRKEAIALAAKIWREDDLDRQLEKRLLGTFSKHLRKSDHKYRMDRLLYEEETNAALRAAGFLSKADRQLATFRQAVVRRDKTAARKLNAVPRSRKADAGYHFSRIQHYRRAREVEKAAQIMLAAPRDPAVLIDPDEWWIERRLVSRAMLDRGHPKTAYRIAAEHSARKPALRAEAEFHAGWYALRYLKDPATAEKHFRRIADIGTTDRTISRAWYWIGRAKAAAGDRPGANEAWQTAARYKTVFYGQLASTELGVRSLKLPAPAKPDAQDRSRFDRRELVAAIRRMNAAGHSHRNLTVYRHLALHLASPGEISLLADLATDQGEHAAALHVGRVADDRGLGVERLAFPTGAIPRETRMYRNVDRALVYSIARQESAFNPRAVSHAGARGLLQLMPDTAKATARSIGLPYRLARLTSDPAYNASLGSAHLSELLGDYNGSYVMTFAGYNAGGSRVRDWIEKYGDPRKMTPHQVVDWIERIPFTETRGYVQKITENMQVYRALLGRPKLQINSDLTRG